MKTHEQHLDDARARIALYENKVANPREVTDFIFINEASDNKKSLADARDYLEKLEAVPARLAWNSSQLKAGKTGGLKKLYSTTAVLAGKAKLKVPKELDTYFWQYYSSDDFPHFYPAFSRVTTYIHRTLGDLEIKRLEIIPVNLRNPKQVDLINEALASMDEFDSLADTLEDVIGRLFPSNDSRYKTHLEAYIAQNSTTAFVSTANSVSPRFSPDKYISKTQQGTYTVTYTAYSFAKLPSYDHAVEVLTFLRVQIQRKNPNAKAETLEHMATWQPLED
jgi:hypothetical protein